MTEWLKQNPWFLTFVVMLCLSIVGVILPKENVIGQLVRRFTTDWLGKNMPTPQKPTVLIDVPKPKPPEEKKGDPT
jgi:hypothetical protein